MKSILLDVTCFGNIYRQSLDLQMHLLPAGSTTHW